jgi:hypothetical protein
LAGPQHYQLLCGVALAVLFFIQLEQGLLVAGLLAVVVGAPAILLRVRVSPLLVLVPLIGGQVYLQYDFPAFRPHAALQVADVVFCAAALAYLGGAYRLLSLWRSILPLDPRQRYHRGAGVVVPLGRLGRIAPHHRPAGLLSRTEIAWFVLQLPLFALLAQGAWILLGVRRELLGLSPRWLQLIQLVWGLGLALFLAGSLFRIGRLWHMDSETARMLLQDVLWHETRREQRRVGRWLAWSRLRGKSEVRG